MTEIYAANPQILEIEQHASKYAMFQRRNQKRN